MYKTICILANSVKNGEYCIAGIEVTNAGDKWHSTGNWVRPVSNRKGGAISKEESLLQNKNRPPELLDVVAIPFIKRLEVIGQPENYLIDSSKKWQFFCRAPKTAIKIFLESPMDLWLQREKNSYKVSSAWVTEYEPQSLYFIELAKIMTYVSVYKSKKRSRANFDYKGENYDLTLTDHAATGRHLPNFHHHPTGIANGITVTNVAVTISLGTEYEYDGCHYKIVAAIIER